MQLTVKTSDLQDMVGKASKCVSNNKLIPLTSLMSIKVTDNILTLTTTDATNYFYVSMVGKVDCENFEVSVLADLFTKLVQKTTSEHITITLNDKILTIKGNGNYTLELPLDESGNAIKFPNKLIGLNKKSGGVVKLSSVKTILAVNKASLALNMEFPVLTCYYCGDSVITSDRKKICRTSIKAFESPMVITPQLMELLGSLSCEDITVETTDDSTVFTTDVDVIYSPKASGIETFPVDAINNLVDQSFTSNCKLPRTVVENVLDRLSLFVSNYDKRAIKMTFTNEGVMFSSKKSNGTELVSYVSSENFEPYSCAIDIEMLKSQIGTQTGDELEVYYGSPVAIKLVNKNVEQIIALLNDDSLEG